MHITTSLSENKLLRKDLEESSRQVREVFQLEQDQTQIPATKQVEDWIYTHPHCVNIIKDTNGVIGSVFAFPTTKSSMHEFLAKHITEHELFTKTRSEPDEKKTAIYFCSINILPTYEGKGIAKIASLELILGLLTKAPKKDTLYYTTYSTKGAHFMEHLKKELTTLTLLERTEKNVKK